MADIFVNILWLAAGIAGLYYGADFLIKGGVSLARRAGVSPLVIGLTLVAFATSAPEFVISASAALQNNTDIALGNVLGSNICNTGLILGLAACISPLAVQKQLFRLDVPVLLAGSVLVCCIYYFTGGISRSAGGIFLALLCIYMAYNIYIAKKADKAEADKSGAPEKLFSVPAALFFVAAGVGLLVAGAKFFLWGAVFFAKLFELSDAVIGLTVVAVGTSLPELATSVVAALKGEADIAIGNVVGSNIFNIFGILGATALIAPVAGATINMIDMAVMLFLVVLLLPNMRTGWRISRAEGACMLCIYCAYMLYLFF